MAVVPRPKEPTARSSKPTFQTFQTYLLIVPRPHSLECAFYLLCFCWFLLVFVVFIFIFLISICFYKFIVKDVFKIDVFIISVFFNSFINKKTQKNTYMFFSVRLINYVLVRDMGVLTSQICRSRLELSNGGFKPILALVGCSLVPSERPR